MTDFLTTLQSTVLLADGAMGSLLFERTGRLSETNHVYESFNVDRPELVSDVYLSYLAAGARCLKTNTFGANRQALLPYGSESRVGEFNRAGVRLAREAIARFQAQHGVSGPFFVLGSIGPTGSPITTPAEIREIYGEQIESLITAGADALILETFSSLEQLERVIDCIQSRPGAPPVVAQMTIHSSSAGHRADFDAVRFVERMHDRGIAVAGVNCCAPWDARAFVEMVKGCPAVRSGAIGLSAMPNGGGFQRIGNRFMSYVNPEYVGRLARSLADLGVRLLGGCCEMHPPHIREMHNYLRARQAGERAVGMQTVTTALAPAGDAEKRPNGTFSRKLMDGRFAISVELVPPRGTDTKATQVKLEFIRQLAEGGCVDAIDITDGSRGIPLMPPGDFIHLTRQRLGWTETAGDRLELIPHFTARDLNLMGVQSRLVGYHANRIHNVLFITGDPPKMSPAYPRSTAVFDLDSVAMIRLAHTCLNAGVDFGSSPLGKQPDPRMHFTIGTGFEPEALNLARELERLQQKIAQGADYVMTQPAFRHEPLAPLEKCRDQCAFLVGVMILGNLEHAQRMRQIPGVVVPDVILDRLAKFNSPADQAKVGQDIAVEQIQWVRRAGWDGLYLMSPGAGAVVLSVLQAGLA
ncbi:MAG: homocysteine S-methyltransferase family protein [Verrucomicrobiota bacterium]